MYICPFFTLELQRYCAYENYVYNELKALTQGVATCRNRVEPARTLLQRAIPPRGEIGEDCRRLRSSDTDHPRIPQTIEY